MDLSCVLEDVSEGIAAKVWFSRVCTVKVVLCF